MISPLIVGSERFCMIIIEPGFELGLEYGQLYFKTFQIIIFITNKINLCHNFVKGQGINQYNKTLSLIILMMVRPSAPSLSAQVTECIASKCPM